MPRLMAPPINTIRSIRSTRSGWAEISIAMLVSGPTGMSVIPRSESSSVRARKETAPSSCGCMTGSSNSGPSSPVDPCTYSAVTRLRSNGTSDPTATGTSVLPISSSTASALRVVFSTVVFPATVVTPRRSISGLAAANMRAMASSWPGSQSMTTGMGVTASPQPWQGWGPTVGLREPWWPGRLRSPPVAATRLLCARPPVRPLSPQQRRLRLRLCRRR